MDAQGFHLLDLLQAVHTTLDKFETALGHLLDQGDGLVPGGFPGIQVPAHGADDVRASFDRPAQLHLGGHLDHHVQALAGGELEQSLQALLPKQGGHEKDRVRSQDLALLDLVLLEDELPPDQRQLHLTAHLGEMLVLAEVEELVGGDREGPGTVFGQALGVGRGLVAFPHLAATRITPGHFTQDGDSRLAELFLQGVVPLVSILDRHGAPLLLDFHIQGLKDGDFL